MQRSGRIIRQGNQNKQVQIFRYVTEGTFDSYLWQTLENKQRFISQIMTSKSPVRSCEDVDATALSYAEIKALCAGNPAIREKMDLDVEVARLRLLKSSHESQKHRIEDQILTFFPQQIQSTQSLISGLQADIALAEKTTPQTGEFAGMEVLGRPHVEKEEAGKAILSACQTMQTLQSLSLGHYRGFAMTLAITDHFTKDYFVTLKGQASHTITLGTDPRGNILRIDNALSDMPARLLKAQDDLDTLHQQFESAKLEIQKPFAQEMELKEKSARLRQLDITLNIASDAHSAQTSQEETKDESFCTDTEPIPPKPSVLAQLRQAKDTTPSTSERKPYSHEEAR